MNMQTDLRRPPKVFACPSCGGEGALWASRYGGNDPDVQIDHYCVDCEGTGNASGDLAQMVEIEDAFHALTTLLLKAKAAKLGGNAAEQETIRLCVERMLEDCDRIVDEELDYGAIYVLCRERGV